jgi:hypothetical protein
MSTGTQIGGEREPRGCDPYNNLDAKLPLMLADELKPNAARGRLRCLIDQYVRTQRRLDDLTLTLIPRVYSKP